MTTTTDEEIRPEEMLASMEQMLKRAEAEGRELTEAEQRAYDKTGLAYFVKATMENLADHLEEPQRIERTAAQPTNPTRPVNPVVRSLSAAALVDGLLERMVANGRARLDVPTSIRALGSTLADNPDPGIAVQPQSLGVIGTYHGILNRLVLALASIPVTSNAVTYTRLTYNPDVGSPSTSGNRATKVQELAQKPQSVLSSEEVTTNLDTYAHWIPASKQVLADVAGLRALLDVLLVSGLLDKTDAQVFADMTTSGRYTPHTPVSGDTIGDGIARVATSLLTAGATSVKVALNPATLLAANIAKTSGSGEYLGLPPNIPATIVSSASVTAGKVLAWADTGAVWANREGVSVVAGWNSDDFVSNRVTLLAEHRGAVLTLDAQHVLYGNAAA